MHSATVYVVIKMEGRKKKNMAPCTEKKVDI